MDTPALVPRAVQLRRLTRLPPFAAGQGLPGKTMAPLRLLWMWLLVAGIHGERAPGDLESSVCEAAAPLLCGVSPLFAENQGNVLPGAWVTGVSPGLLSCLKPRVSQVMACMFRWGDAKGVTISSGGNQRDPAGGAHRLAKPWGTRGQCPLDTDSRVLDGCPHPSHFEALPHPGDPTEACCSPI